MGQGFLQIGFNAVYRVYHYSHVRKIHSACFLGERTLLDPFMNPIERSIYVLVGVGKKDNMTGWQYIWAVLYSNLFMGILVYSLIYYQRLLPWNPNGFGSTYLGYIATYHNFFSDQY